MAPPSSSKQRDYDYLFKLVLIGDSGVGKSCLLLRFAVRWFFVFNTCHWIIRLSEEYEIRYLIPYTVAAQ